MRMRKKFNRKNDKSKKLKDKIYSLRIEKLELQEKIRKLKEENESLRELYEISDNISGEDIEKILWQTKMNAIDKRMQELKERAQKLKFQK